MQFSTSIVMALAAIIPSTFAHIRVISPPVYKNLDPEKLYNTGAPLNPDGSDYPCFGTANTDGPIPTYEAGTSQNFELGGSAVHGGGSCQISITYDLPVHKGSKFYVLKSFHGDCPIKAESNLPAEDSFILNYEIPADLPGGDAAVAWTWFNRIGNREMYMRCAPATIKSASTSDSALLALPPMFKAHIANIGGAPESCVLKEGELFRFPNPGKNVHNGPVTLLDVPAVCGSPVAPTEPKPAPVPTSSAEPVPTYPAESEIPTTSLPADAQPTEDLNVIAPPANPPQGGDEEPATPVDEPVPTVTVVPVEPETPETPVKPIPSSGRCNEDGAIICTSSSTWAVCDHGAVVPMGNVADGMVCKGGVMEFAKSKGAVRGMKYGHQHRRRHHKRAL